MFLSRDVHTLKRPSKRNQGSLYQQVKTNIVDSENQWILRSNDLAALAHDTEHGWFNVQVEDWLNRLSRPLLLVSEARTLSRHRKFPLCLMETEAFIL